MSINFDPMAYTNLLRETETLRARVAELEGCVAATQYLDFEKEIQVARAEEREELRGRVAELERSNIEFSLRLEAMMQELPEEKRGGYMWDRRDEIEQGIRAKEREACAQVCDLIAHHHIAADFGDAKWCAAADECAAAIRARGNTE